ncbi:MAG: extracellular solute-binding protein [Microbacteriaceae bacterium]|nr:extracellular solute-binding protein [Microbacteriaceae bacterium]
MNRKKLTAAVGVLAMTAGVALAGCTSATPGPGATDGATAAQVDLKIWSWRTQDVDIYNNTIFPAFEAANPGINVEFEAPVVNTEYNQALTTALVGSDGPDLAMVRAYGGLQGWTKDLQPLDDIVPGLDEIDPAVLQGSKGVDGKIYSVPTVVQTMQMFYNKDLFDQFGLSVPKTWDEFIEVNEALLENGVAPMAVGAKDSWVLPLVSDVLGAARYGATEFEAKVTSGETTFADPDYVAAIQLVKDLQKYYAEGDGVTGVGVTDAETLFSAGLAGMYPGGTFELTTFLTNDPDINVGTFPVPTPPDSVSAEAVVPAYADGGWAINADIDPAKQEAAEKLINWMYSTEFGQLVADNLLMFSAAPGVTYSDPVLQQMWADYEASPAAYLMLVNYRYCDPTADSQLGPDLQNMFLGTMTAEQAGQQVADAVAGCELPKF